MSVELIRGLYDYHRWANRRLFDVASGLGDAVSKDMGKHWSVPTLKGMFAHLCSADFLWLSRWRGVSPARMRVKRLQNSDLRAKWDVVEADQRLFVEGLTALDLARPITYKNTEGVEFTVVLGPLLQHVVNHATHHRSEAATMITLISSSPPDTGINTYRTAVVKG